MYVLQRDFYTYGEHKFLPFGLARILHYIPQLVSDGFLALLHSAEVVVWLAGSSVPALYTVREVQMQHDDDDTED